MYKVVASSPAKGYLILEGCAELIFQMSLLLCPLLRSLAVLLHQVVVCTLQLTQVAGRLSQLRRGQSESWHPLQLLLEAQALGVPKDPSPTSNPITANQISHSGPYINI